MRPLRHLALASASPRRRELLTSLGIAVRVVASSYVELPIAGASPRDTAIAHAQGKAAGAASSDELIVAADTVVDLDGDALGKPRDFTESRAMIERLAGRDHLVHTAFTLRDDARAAAVTACSTTEVRFAALTPEQIAAYVAGGDGLDKAGAYGIQGFGATLVEHVVGDYFTVVGFPLGVFARTLPALGYVLLPPARSDDIRAAHLTEVTA